MAPVESVKHESPVQPEFEEQAEESQATEEVNEQVKDEDEKESEKEKESEIDQAISRIIAENESADESSEFDEQASGGLMPALGRIISWLSIVAITYATFSYKVESSAIGFCDRGSNTSQTLDAILVRRATFDACAKARTTALLAALNGSSVVEESEMEACPLPPLIPLPHPDACTPCPDHATCTQFSVTCDSGYLLKPHILLSFVPVSASDSSLATTHAPHLGKSFLQAFSSLTSGLPGFGSVGLPPRCTEDPQRKRNIGALGKSIETMLGRERGLRVCHGQRANASEPETGIQAAIRWGVEVDKLRKDFRASAAVSSLLATSSTRKG